ncbi:hypothetical protein QUF63_05960 [Anaerolineales bacterium HSG25]|nr:hypothetical protein [Anaerolineales bacterium HSG25]
MEKYLTGLTELTELKAKNPVNLVNPVEKVGSLGLSVQTSCLYHHLPASLKLAGRLPHQSI